MVYKGLEETFWGHGHVHHFDSDSYFTNTHTHTYTYVKTYQIVYLAAAQHMRDTETQFGV